MARSITFVIDDQVDTQITVTENEDGTLSFNILVLDTGKIGDLRALFFDLNGLIADDNLSVLSGDHVTESVFDEGNVDTVGGDGNINGSVTNEFGEFDVGIGFGTSGPSEDDLQFTSFTLGHALQPLSLDMIDISDFGIRTTSVGMKAGSQANGVAQNDVLTVDENQSGMVHLLINDTNGAALEVDRVFDDSGDFTAVAGGFQRTVVIGGLVLGTLTVGSDGTASFVANGPDVDQLAEGAMPSLSFTYQSVAGDGSMATADVTLTINGVNDAPTMDDGVLALDNDEPSATLELSPLGDDIDSDDDGTTLTYALVGTPSEGSATIIGTQLSFDPGSDFDDLALGETRDVVLAVLVTDSHGATATGTVTVTVTGTNSAPVAQPDLTVTDEETILTGNLFADNTAGMDFDPDGDTFTIHTVDGQPAVFGVPITLSSGATLILEANGDFTFDPRGAFDFVPGNGQSADGIDYTVIDSNGAVSNEVRANFSVQGVNDAPVANDDMLSTDEDTPLSFNAADILANDTDADLGEDPALATINGVAVVAGAVIATDHGSIMVGAGGALDYTPDAHYGGPDSFVYRATDGAELSDPATVSITVTPVADAPTLAISAPGGGAGGDLTPVPQGNSQAVNTTTADTQSDANVVALQGGGFVVVWASNNQDGSAWGVYGQIFDSTGAAVGGEFQINDTTHSWQRYPSVSATDNGGFIVTWSSYLVEGGTNSSLGIAGRAFDATGTPLTGEFTINTSQALDQQQSEIEALDSGGHVVGWISQHPSGTALDLVVQVIDDSGALVGGEITITSNSATSFDLVGLSGGGWVVTWSEPGADGSGYGVFSQHYDASGVPQGAPVLVNTYTTDDQTNVAAQALNGGGYVIAWESNGQDGHVDGIFAQIFDDFGVAVGIEFQVNSYTANRQTYPSISALDDGGFIVTWNSLGQDGSLEGLYAQRFDASGNAIGNEYQVSEVSTGHQTNFYHNATAVLDTGQIVTVYEQDWSDIFLRFADVPGAFDGVEDQPLDIDLTAALVDTDGSEHLTITLSGFPAGATFTIGSASGSDWVIENAETLDLSMLQMIPPVDWHGTFVLNAVATATESANGDTAETSASVTLTIADVPDAPLFTGQDDVVNFGGQAAAASIPVVVAGTYQNGTQYGGLDGNDVVWLADTLADAVAAGYDPSVAFDGGDGNDQIFGGALDDTIIGGAGNDGLQDRGGNNILDGGAGNDNVVIRLGNDHAIGGAGTDFLQFSLSDPGVTADIAAGVASGQGNDTFTGFEIYAFTNSADHVTGSAAGERIWAYSGDDFIDAGDGNDWVLPGLGDDTFNGGDGVDRVQFDPNGAGVTVDLGLGTATGQGNDVLIGVEQVFGSNGDDLIIGDSTSQPGPSSGFGVGYNGVFGLGGNDTIYGLGGDDDLSDAGTGDDQVFGGDGDDALGGGDGNDTLDGGAGTDTVYYYFQTTDVVANLATGTATQGTDTDTLIAIENLVGSHGNDDLTGDGGANVLDGWSGDDTLTGGAGADSFVFDLRKSDIGDDVITDFEIGTDVIRLLGGQFNTISDMSPQQVGADVLLTLTNGNTLLLEGVLLGDLPDGDFVF